MTQKQQRQQQHQEQRPIIIVTSKQTTRSMSKELTTVTPQPPVSRRTIATRRRSRRSCDWFLLAVVVVVAAAWFDSLVPGARAAFAPFVSSSSRSSSSFSPGCAAISSYYTSTIIPPRQQHNTRLYNRGREDEEPPLASSKRSTKKPSKKKRTKKKRHDKNIAKDEDGAVARKWWWSRWMKSGAAGGMIKPRGTNRVILREAEALGGVARSDRYSSKDWWHNTVTLPNSAILRDIGNPVLACAAFATALSLLHAKLLRMNLPAAAARLYLPTAPHSLSMSALGLLLVFRTNSAYQRFVEGRKIWERIVNHSRDLYRMLVLYEGQIGSSKRRRLQRLLAAFPYLLRHRIRPNSQVIMHRVDDPDYERDPEHSILLYQDAGPASDNDPEAAAAATVEEETGIMMASQRKSRPLFWVDKRTLPWRLLPTEARNSCARAQNRPLWVCDRMAAELRNVPDDGTNFSARERLALISHVDKLSQCIGGAERIHQTVVPLNYARHTLRALTMWLFSLPFCIVKDLGLLTGPVLLIVSWLLFGVYEIGYAIEDPFQGTLRLSILCDTIRRDVLADEHIRSTAFRLETSSKTPPTTRAEEEKKNKSNRKQQTAAEGSTTSSSSGSSRNSVVVPQVSNLTDDDTDAYQ